MAIVTIPPEAVMQPDSQESLTENGLVAISLSWSASFSTLQTTARAIARGDEYDGMLISTWSLRRSAGDQGVLTISFIEKDVTDDTGLRSPKKETWSIKTCRNDVSILGYCGKDENNPNREWIECWQKEPDAEVAAGNNYTRPDGSISDLLIESHGAATSELIAKIRQGIESVMRFYPQITRRRVYSAPPDGMMENLGYIDTPGSPGANAKHPGNLSNIINKHQWVKIQDDCDESSDDSWTRVESWVGILKGDSPDSAPWDEDLYGANRWPMPYNHAQSQ
jgi:hypothetical protein